MRAVRVVGEPDHEERRHRGPEGGARARGRAAPEGGEEQHEHRVGEHDDGPGIAGERPAAEAGGGGEGGVRHQPRQVEEVEAAAEGEGHERRHHRHRGQHPDAEEARGPEAIPRGPREAEQAEAKTGVDGTGHRDRHPGLEVQEKGQAAGEAEEQGRAEDLGTGIREKGKTR